MREMRQWGQSAEYDGVEREQRPTRPFTIFMQGRLPRIETQCVRRICITGCWAADGQLNRFRA